jgi:hypothetical protein
MRATFIADPEDFLHRLIEFAGDLEGRHQLLHHRRCPPRRRPRDPGTVHQPRLALSGITRHPLVSRVPLDPEPATQHRERNPTRPSKPNKLKTLPRHRRRPPRHRHLPIRSVHYVPEHLPIMSPVRTLRWGRTPLGLAVVRPTDGRGPRSKIQDPGARFPGSLRRHSFRGFFPSCAEGARNVEAEPIVSE